MRVVMVRFAALAAFLFSLIVFTPASAQPLPGARQVDAALHSSRAAVAPGERFTIVLRETINEGWHTYWRNPGDSGEPTSLTWTLPAGWSASELQWPAPEAVPFAMLVNYGYEGEVLFPVEITVPANARVGSTVTLTAAAYWLVCSDICIPEDATLTLTLPVAAAGRDDPQWAPRIAEAVHEASGSVPVDPHRFGEGEIRSDGGGEMQDEREVAREVGPIWRREVDAAGPDAGGFDARALGRVTKAGDAPDLVVPRQALGQRKGDATGRSGDQDPLAPQRRARRRALGGHVDSLRSCIGGASGSARTFVRRSAPGGLPHATALP